MNIEILLRKRNSARCNFDGCRLALSTGDADADVEFNRPVGGSAPRGFEFGIDAAAAPDIFASGFKGDAVNQRLSDRNSLGTETVCDLSRRRFAAGAAGGYSRSRAS